MREIRRDVLSDEEQAEELRKRAAALEQQRQSAWPNRLKSSPETATTKDAHSEDDRLRERIEALEQQRRSAHRK